MSFLSDEKVLKGYVDSDARVDRLRRANRQRALQSELAQSAADDSRERLVERRTRAVQRESALAAELQATRTEELRQEKMLQLVRAQAPELRELEEKLRAAHTAKERQVQIQAHAVAKEQESRDEKRWMDKAVADAKRFEAEEQVKKEEHKARLRDAQDVQKMQIQYREATLAEAQEAYRKERAEVDAVVAKVREEDFLDMLAKVEKQRATQAEHNEFGRQREERKRQERERHVREEQAIRDFLAEQSKRKESGERLKREREAAKQRVLEDQSRQIATERAKKEELEALINDYYEEQRAAKAYEEEVLEKQRRIRDKEMMLAANAEQLRQKALQKEKELAAEQVFRAKMMEKFAEDDRVDEMNRVRRHQVKLEHAAKVAELIAEKRRLHDEDRAREKALDEAAGQREAERQRIVAEERVRILREHADTLAQFLPKGVATSKADLDLILAHVQSTAGAAEFRGTQQSATSSLPAIGGGSIGRGGSFGSR